ncbi:hypothetical protein MVEN_02128700 [Mycena venus]|uniref:Uncharacterized protein n=1 Tax=Mycena venus TaxID=2733690 RepID=A0A8H6X9F4_9AGAR|nr:hypothetical protein MVEN_02128700 [Mycena venus]
MAGSTSDQPTTVKISSEERSFIVSSSSDSDNDDEETTVYFTDYRGSGAPPTDVGTPGDTYIDIDSAILHARYTDAWLPWPGTAKRSASLTHPIHDAFLLWCNTAKNQVSWMRKSKMKKIQSSATEVVSRIIAVEARRNGKRKASSDGSPDVNIPAKKARAVETPIPSQPGPSTAPAALAWRRCPTNPPDRPTGSFDNSNHAHGPPDLVPIHDFAVNVVHAAVRVSDAISFMRHEPVVANFIHATTSLLRGPAVSVSPAGEKRSTAVDGVEGTRNCACTHATTIRAPPMVPPSAPSPAAVDVVPSSAPPTAPRPSNASAAHPPASTRIPERPYVPRPRHTRPAESDPLPANTSSTTISPSSHQAVATRTNGAASAEPSASHVVAQQIESRSHDNQHHSAAALEAANLQLQTQNGWLKFRNDELNYERDILRRELDGLRHQRDAWIRERDEVKHEWDVLRRERDGLLHQRDAWIRERDEMQHATRQIGDLLDRNTVIVQLNTVLTRENATLKSEIETLMVSNASLSAQNASLGAQNDLQNDSVRTMEEENRLLKNENASLKKKVRAEELAPVDHPSSRGMPDPEAVNPTSRAEDSTEMSAHIKEEPAEVSLNTLGSGTLIEVIDLTLDSDDETNEAADSAGVDAALNTTTRSEVDATVVAKNVNGQIGIYPGNQEEGRRPTTSPSLPEDALDSAEIELALRIKPEGEEEVRSALEDTPAALQTHPRRLTKTHIEILWTYIEGDRYIVCDACNSIGSRYELPLNTTLDELATHSEEVHPDYCDALITQTLGMSEEEIQQWLKDLDD